MTAVFDFPQSLRCRECERDYPIEPLSICEDCFGPLEPHYELHRVRADRFKKEADNGPTSLWTTSPLE